MTDNERNKIEQERVERCDNCKHCICLREIYTNSNIACDCRKFSMPIEPRLLVSCKYYKQCKNKQKVLK